MSARIHEIDDGAAIASGFVDPRCEQSNGFGIIEFESASFTFFGDFAGHVDKESFLFVRRQMHGLRLGREYFGSVSVLDYPKNFFTGQLFHQINIFTATATPKVITIARMTLGFILPASIPPK